MQWCVDLDAPIEDDDEAIAYDPRLGLALRARVTPSPKASPRLQGFPPPRAKVWGSSGGGGGGGGGSPHNSGCASSFGSRLKTILHAVLVGSGWQPGADVSQSNPSESLTDGSSARHE